MSEGSTRFAPAGLAVAVLAVSTSAVLVRATTAPSIIAALYRVTFTVVLLVPFAVVRPGKLIEGIDRRATLGGVLAGVALALHFATWFESLEWTSIAASVTLVQCQPVFVVIGAGVVLNERVTRQTVVGITVALCGMVFLSGAPTTQGSLFGNGLAITGAALAGGYVLAGRSLRRRVNLIGYVLVVYSACAVVLCLLAIASGHTLVGYSDTDWLLFLAMAVGPGLLGHTVINWVLAHVRSTVVSVALLGEPVGATLLGLVVFGEMPSAVTIVGGAVVLCGIAITALSE
ncbi:DMT family transporter [Halocatena halophila]|uniref:DMT family transporter n=1 Tax=Halocatena halophila TaxID=2814576 RepID=UPI002ED41F20